MSNGYSRDMQLCIPNTDIKEGFSQFAQCFDTGDTEGMQVYVSAFCNEYGITDERIAQEAFKFLSYWTEGFPRKMRWEREKVFDIKRRFFVTWLGNAKLPKKKDIEAFTTL